MDGSTILCKNLDFAKLIFDHIPEVAYEFDEFLSILVHFVSLTLPTLDGFSNFERFDHVHTISIIDKNSPIYFNSDKSVWF